MIVGLFTFALMFYDAKNFRYELVKAFPDKKSCEIYREENFNSKKFKCEKINLD